MSDSLLDRIGVSGYNKPKRTPKHPTKSHVVVAKEGDKVKTIRYGQQGVSGSPPSEGESESAGGSGERMRRPGSPGSPTAKAFKESAKTARR